MPLGRWIGAVLGGVVAVVVAVGLAQRRVRDASGKSSFSSATHSLALSDDRLTVSAPGWRVEVPLSGLRGEYMPDVGLRVHDSTIGVPVQMSVAVGWPVPMWAGVVESAEISVLKQQSYPSDADLFVQWAAGSVVGQRPEWPGMTLVALCGAVLGLGASTLLRVIRIRPRNA